MSKPVEPVADQPRKGWMSRERTVLWKLGASVVWITGVAAMVVLFFALIPKPRPDMTPEEKQATARDFAQMGSGLAGILGIGIPGGIWVILTRPRVRKKR